MNERERAKLVATAATLENYAGMEMERLREDVDGRLARRDWRRYVRDARERLGTVRREVSA